MSKTVSSNLRKILECGAALAMIASAGLASAGTSANASRRRARRPRVQRQVRVNRHRSRQPRNRRQARAARKTVQHQLFTQPKTKKVLFLYMNGKQAQIKTVTLKANQKPTFAFLDATAPTKKNYRILQGYAKRLQHSNQTTGKRVVTPNETYKQAKTNQNDAITLHFNNQHNLNQLINKMTSKSPFSGATRKNDNLRYMAAYLGISQKQMRQANPGVSLYKPLHKGMTVNVPASGKNATYKSLLNNALRTGSESALENYFNHRDGIRGSNIAAKNWIVRHESNDRYRVLSYGHNAYGKYQLNHGYLTDLLNSHRLDYSPFRQEMRADQYVQGRYGTWNHAKRFWLGHNWY